MPAATAKSIKRRMKSVANTRKITKAMELVAASKMRKATSSVLGTRPFAKLSWETITAITTQTEDISHPLLEENTKSKKVLFVLFSSDRGLAGAYNSNISKTVLDEVKRQKKDGIHVEAIAIGKRGMKAFTREDIPVIATFEGLSNKPTFNDIAPVARLILEEYKKKTYRKVIIGYTDFISALSQEPTLLELLPLGLPKDETQPQALDPSKEIEYKFEPSPQVVLDRILPRLVDTMVYQALLESTASEHSARMMAMRNATDNAGEMLGDLKLTYNRIRQSNITQEIAEISSGKAALE